MESKSCQQCHANFEIGNADLEFCQKMGVPVPTWCPECRMQNLMMFRNETSLYHGKCHATGQSIVSAYHPDRPLKIYSEDYWWGDQWEAMDYGRDYDLARPFLEQFYKLYIEVPHNNLNTGNNEDSPFTNHTYDSKRCYLCPSTVYSENVMYSYGADGCRDCIDCQNIKKCELCYECNFCENCYSCTYLLSSTGCREAHFLVDCHDCANCFMCFNLKHKEYCINNEQVTKEEYEARVNELLKPEKQAENRENYDLLKNKALYKFANITNSENVSGDKIGNSENVQLCFNVYDLQDARYCVRVFKAKDIQDVYGCIESEMIYRSINTATKAYNCRFCTNCFYEIRNLEYCDSCHYSSDLFGCVGLKHKQYCILNKQYSKEEYEQLVTKIKEQMNSKPYQDNQGLVYKYGDFFPASFSPFAYNESIAFEYFPLAKEEAVARKFRWVDVGEKNITPTILSVNLPSIQDTDEKILSEIIGCGHAGNCNHKCTTAYKIQPAELAFYKQMNLPLPTLCPNCRYYGRIEKYRNPIMLIERQCQCGGVRSDGGMWQNRTEHFHNSEHCPNHFLTTYDLERSEIIYCEDCYRTEMI